MHQIVTGGFPVSLWQVTEKIETDCDWQNNVDIFSALVLKGSGNF